MDYDVLLKGIMSEFVGEASKNENDYIDRVEIINDDGENEYLLPHSNGVTIEDPGCILEVDSDEEELRSENQRNNNLCKYLPIVKVVDCNKFPWYYKLNSSKSKSDEEKENVENKQLDVEVSPDVFNVDNSDMVFNKSENVNQVIENKTSQPEKASKSESNIKNVDFKRNKGLVGLKIGLEPVLCDAKCIKKEIKNINPHSTLSQGNTKSSSLDTMTYSAESCKDLKIKIRVTKNEPTIDTQNIIKSAGADCQQKCDNPDSKSNTNNLVRVTAVSEQNKTSDCSKDEKIREDKKHKIFTEDMTLLDTARIIVKQVKKPTKLIMGSKIDTTVDVNAVKIDVQSSEQILKSPPLTSLVVANKPTNEAKETKTVIAMPTKERIFEVEKFKTASCDSVINKDSKKLTTDNDLQKHIISSSSEPVLTQRKKRVSSTATTKKETIRYDNRKQIYEQTKNNAFTVPITSDGIGIKSQSNLKNKSLNANSSETIHNQKAFSTLSNSVAWSQPMPQHIYNEPRKELNNGSVKNTDQIRETATTTVSSFYPNHLASVGGSTINCMLAPRNHETSYYRNMEHHLIQSLYCDFRMNGGSQQDFCSRYRHLMSASYYAYSSRPPPPPPPPPQCSPIPPRRSTSRPMRPYKLNSVHTTSPQSHPAPRYPSTEQFRMHRLTSHQFPPERYQPTISEDPISSQYARNDSNLRLVQNFVSSLTSSEMSNMYVPLDYSSPKFSAQKTISEPVLPKITFTMSQSPTASTGSPISSQALYPGCVEIPSDVYPSSKQIHLQYPARNPLQPPSRPSQYSPVIQSVIATNPNRINHTQFEPHHVITTSNLDKYNDPAPYNVPKHHLSSYYPATNMTLPQNNVVSPSCHYPSKKESQNVNIDELPIPVINATKQFDQSLQLPLPNRPSSQPKSSTINSLQDLYSIPSEQFFSPPPLEKQQLLTTQLPPSENSSGNMHCTSSQLTTSTSQSAVHKKNTNICYTNQKLISRILENEFQQIVDIKNNKRKLVTDQISGPQMEQVGISECQSTVQNTGDISVKKEDNNKNNDYPELKKMLLTSMGYSPPILPIPTYENMLSKKKMHIPVMNAAVEYKKKKYDPNQRNFSEKNTRT